MDQLVYGILSTVVGTIINYSAVGVYNWHTGSSKNFFWKNTYPTLKSVKIPYEFEELKKRARILVIDDEDGFPVKIFQDEGYSIEKWDSVENYGKLESGFFDIIILDIKGVATHISKEDGLGVIESLKRTNPAQIIVAHSQHSFDLSKSKFWELADEKIAKPTDFLKMKQIVDNLIRNKFSPERYINTLHDVLIENGYKSRQIKKIDTKLIKNFRKDENINWREVLEGDSINSDLLIQVSAIGNTLIRMYK